jgi:predicted HTH transcriptional regulator
MVWARKKDTSEEMSYLVDQTLRIIGITPKAVEKHLAKLKAEGIIKRDGPDKGGSWTVL